MTKEHKRKISEGCRRNGIGKWMVGRKSPMLGKKHTLKARQKIKIARAKQGNKVWNSGLKGWNLGHPVSLETRRKLSEMQKGEKGNNWKGGIYPVNKAIRDSLEYKLWRQSVFERDRFTCQDCGQLRGDIEADHIKPFSLFPELRFELSNGRTLCHNCHLKTSTYGFNLRWNKFI